uniref:Core protein VP7 n=1 Tax=Kammavanpettai virus TaxID=2282480 RepID=A0A3G1RP46_9REOV|nr:major core protein [Kammavanpettai virus]
MLALTDPKARRDITLSSGLAVFTNHYNCGLDRWITLTPATQEEHKNIFLCALDIVASVLNVNASGLILGYVPNPQTVAHLSKETVSYTANAAIIANKIANARSRGSVAAQFYDPYVDAETFVPPGCYYRMANGNFEPGYTSYRTVMFALGPGERRDVTAFVRPRAQGLTQYQMSYTPYTRYLMNQGGTAVGSTQITVTIPQGVMNPSHRYFIGRQAVINLSNNSANLNALVSFTVHYYHIARPGWDVYPSYRSDVASTYSFISDEWNTIRNYFLHTLGLPRTRPEEIAPNEPRQIWAYAMLGRLADIFLAHTPDLVINHIAQPVMFGQDLLNNMGVD